MAYTKHTWTTGEVITAGNLNHMEQGIADAGAGGMMAIHITENGKNHILDKTWQEIYDAMAAGVFCYIVTVYNNTNLDIYVVRSAYFEDNKYHINDDFEANTANDYPSYLIDPT